MESHNNCVDTFPTASQQRGSERSLGGVEIDNQTVAQRFARGARVNDCGAVTMWLCSASYLIIWAPLSSSQRPRQHSCAIAIATMSTPPPFSTAHFCPRLPVHQKNSRPSINRDWTVSKALRKTTGVSGCSLACPATTSLSSGILTVNRVAGKCTVRAFFPLFGAPRSHTSNT